MSKIWCDDCAEYVNLIDGEERGDVCEKCESSAHLDFSENGKEPFNK
jgi:hypothetical protein